MDLAGSVSEQNGVFEGPPRTRRTGYLPQRLKQRRDWAAGRSNLISGHLRHAVNRKQRVIDERASAFLEPGDSASGTAKEILCAIEIVVVGEDGGALESLKVGIEGESIREEPFAGQSFFQGRAWVDLPQAFARPLDGGALLCISLLLKQVGPQTTSLRVQEPGSPRSIRRIIEPQNVLRRFQVQRPIERLGGGFCPRAIGWFSGKQRLHPGCAIHW
jgi:hypothetical protein